ncbi:MULTISPECIES: hypothetical protein [unclassified Gordonia (in: high G+C Gram-positive bacteria)]
MPGTGAVQIAVAVCAVAAAVCALTAAYVYLRGTGDPVRDDRNARRWLVGTAVLGFAAIALRFISLLV